ncbi:MIP family channel protein [Nitzschia inconspicua]|uniref:MIP family channel protein n=1 Tax=Nitzschia inconspicua TaxID=303405 RepID=A0A9K3KJ91_9STRA|nr:MIP family channel protein [Nitzschia inconspicua]
MVKDHVATISSVFDDVLNFFPPGIVLSVAAGCVEHRKYWNVYVKEFVGTMLMVGFTFSAGKWIGQDSWMVAWAIHAVGVVLADYFGGGQMVNPAVTVSMWSLEKCNYTECFVRIAGQMGGGLVAFPLFHAVSNQFQLTPFGGPEFKKENDVEAFLSEFTATFFLMWAIYLLNWEMNFGDYHYIIKQTLTAIAIRALIELFPVAGPAINPMLATAWYVFGVGTTYEYPDDNIHYFVYWVAPILGGILAAVTYAIYNGDQIFGMKIPVGPLKGKKDKKD